VNSQGLPGIRLRDDLADLPPYRAPQREQGIRLNTNETPLPPSSAFDEKFRELTSDAALHRYPDRDATLLRSEFAKWCGWDPDGVWMANGSNEILQTLLLAFGGAARKLLLFPPTYSMYSHLARVCATPVVAWPLAEPWVLTPEIAVKAVEEHQPSMTLVCSPNNPTGSVTGLDTIEALLNASGGLVIVDHAYVDFGGQDAQELLAKHERLVIVRSFSKSWRLAGARLGALLAQPKVVESIQVARLPYHLSSLTQAAGLAAVSVADEMLQHCQQLVRNRDLLAEQMRALPGVEVFDSGANFLLFRTPIEASELWSRIAARGVLVRDMSSVIPFALRVTASTISEQDAFIAALKESL
jgi:histidinol-phosphate aminotransferase